MVKTPTRTNTSTGFINVGLLSTEYALCQIEANSQGETLSDFVHIALKQRRNQLAELRQEREWLAFK